MASLKSNPVKLWEDFLNPDVIKGRLVRAGLFLVAHEMLVSAIKENLHAFYADSWSADKGWATGDDYRSEVLSLDPKSKEDPHRSSIAWLKKNDVLTDDDEMAIRRLTLERNRFAHELQNVIGGSNEPDFDTMFSEIVALVTKIKRWWILNVELETDPDWAGKVVEVEDVTPGSSMLLQIMAKVALGADDEAWELYKEFSRIHSEAS